MGKSSQTTTATPTNPAWVTSNVQNLTGQIQGLTGTDPTSYIAPWNGYQQQAGDLAQTTASGTNPYTQKAFDTLDLVGNYKSPQATAASLLTNLQAYMSPYTDQVVNTSLAGYDKNAAQQVAQNLADQAKTSAFASSRGAIQGAELSSGLAMNRGQLESGLRDQGFQVGAGLANQDAQRQTEVSLANAQLNLAKQNQGLDIARALADMGIASDQGSRQDVASLLDVGNTKYAIDNALAQAPISLLGTQVGLTGQLPYQLFNGQTQNSTTSQSPLTSLGTLALGLGSLGTGGLLGGVTGGLSGLLGGAASAPSWLGYGS